MQTTLGRRLSIGELSELSYHNGSQLVSLKLNPSNRQTTPPTINPSPMKSKSSMCSRRVLPLWGFKLRKKNKRPAAKPPVGLASKSLQTEGGLKHFIRQHSQINEEAP